VEKMAYTTAAKIEGITQFATSASTNPTTTEVAVWITEVEADADARALASYTLTDYKLDVPAKLTFPPKNTIAWLEAVAGQK